MTKDYTGRGSQYFDTYCTTFNAEYQLSCPQTASNTRSARRQRGSLEDPALTDSELEKTNEGKKRKTRRFLTPDVDNPDDSLPEEGPSSASSSAQGSASVLALVLPAHGP